MRLTTEQIDRARPVVGAAKPMPMRVPTSRYQIDSIDDVIEMMMELRRWGYVIVPIPSRKQRGRPPSRTVSRYHGLIDAATATIKADPQGMRPLHEIVHAIARRFPDIKRSTIERELRRAWKATGCNTWREFRNAVFCRTAELVD